MLALLVPILIQTGITNFVSMLDNLMIGRTGTAQIAGVAVANQILFVFMLCIFGLVSGAGVIGAQYYGRGDFDGFRNILRFKLTAVTVLTAAACVLFLTAGDFLIMRFIHEDDPSVRQAALEYAGTYLRISLVGLVPYGLSQALASTLRETGRSVLPMIAGLCAVAVNLFLNFLLISGRLGAPALGVAGAAIATVASRYVELGIIAVCVAAGRKRYPFMRGALKTLRVPGALVREILIRSLPLVFNETMWALGMTVIARLYSLRGLDVVTAYNIETTFFNLFFVAFQSAGSAAGILVGQRLGAGEMEEAKDDARKMIAFSFALSIVIGAAFAALSGVIPGLYNVGDDVRSLASSLMLICAVTLPLEAVVNELYFIIRSGGRVAITIIFDSGISWVVLVPAVSLLVRFSPLSVPWIFFVDRALSLVKMIIGIIMFRHGKWRRRI